MLSHRDQAAISPFDSAVQGGDAVWEGLRLYDGRIFRLDEHLARLRRSAAWRWPSPRSRRTRRSPGRSAARCAANADERRRAHPAHADPRGEDHQRHGPAAQPGRADPDRAGRAQAAGLRPVRDHADHLQRAPPAAGRLDPKIHHNNLLTSILAKIEANVAGADDAVMLDQPRVRRRDQRHPRVPRRRRALARRHAAACPEGITRAVVLELAADAGIALPRRATQPDPVLRAQTRCS